MVPTPSTTVRCVTCNVVISATDSEELENHKDHILQHIEPGG